MEHVGQISALASAALWVVTGLAFAVAGRKVGAWVVNAVRIWFALGCLLILHALLNGSALPAHSVDAWLWLSLSGVLGLVFRHNCFFLMFEPLGLLGIWLRIKRYFLAWPFRY